MKILLVEDHIPVAESTVMLLRVLGHEVRHAKTGTDAVQMAKAEAPEIAVIDIGLPDMSGFDVAKAMRAEATLDQTVLVALTGYDIQDRMNGSGFDYYFKKPMDFNALPGLKRTPAA